MWWPTSSLIANAILLLSPLSSDPEMSFWLLHLLVFGLSSVSDSKPIISFIHRYPCKYYLWPGLVLYEYELSLSTGADWSLNWGYHISWVWGESPYLSLFSFVKWTWPPTSMHSWELSYLIEKHLGGVMKASHPSLPDFLTPLPYYKPFSWDIKTFPNFMSFWLKGSSCSERRGKWMTHWTGCYPQNVVS